MKFNNTTQYAIRILNYINLSDKEQRHSAKELADALDINYKFLTTIMTKLAKAKLLHSIRGKDGGFQLAKATNEIFIIDIIKLFDDSFEEDACILGLQKCNDKKKCFMHDKWIEKKSAMLELFKNTSIEDIKQRSEKL